MAAEAPPAAIAVVDSSKSTDAKEVRNPNRAFVHAVTWQDYKPYLDRLEAGVHKLIDTVFVYDGDHERIQQKRAKDHAGTTKQFRNFHNDKDQVELCSEHIWNPLHVEILTDILLSRKKNSNTKSSESKSPSMDLRAGDIVDMQFTSERGIGIFFFDGTKVILPGDENSDYYRLPEVFTIPTYRPDYWDDGDFVRFSVSGAFTFELDKFPKELKDAPTLMFPTGGNECISMIPFVINGKSWYIILLSDDADVDISKLSANHSFWTDGHCFGLDEVLREVDDAHWTAMLDSSGIRDLTNENTIVIRVTDEQTNNVKSESEDDEEEPAKRTRVESNTAASFE